MANKNKADRPSTPNRRPLTTFDLSDAGLIGKLFITKRQLQQEAFHSFQVTRKLIKAVEWDKFRLNAALELIYEAGLLPANAVHELTRKQLLTGGFENTPVLELVDLFSSDYNFSQEEQLLIANNLGKEDWPELIRAHHLAQQSERQRYATPNQHAPSSPDGSGTDVANPEPGTAG